ncbi:MAG: NAD(P)H-dependent oxidoreductase [Eubacteriales bacterium]|nr:NAD(P)H-dependent oxidoreductase [Eubacteriales bacterium]
MKIVIIHGQGHEGSTCMVARQVAGKLMSKVKEESELKEFFLPRDFNEPCRGCMTCFTHDLSRCPHFEKLRPLSDAMLWADVIIMESPVYVYHATGQMMSFLDHFGTWWIVHRPRPEMTNKQAVAISTAAGGGMGSTCKDMADSLEMWGVGKVYRLGIGVQATKPSEIPEGIQKKIEKKTDILSEKLFNGYGKKRMNLRAKKWFYILRMMHKAFAPSEPDHGYWERQGWHADKRPWKD